MEKICKSCGHQIVVVDETPYHGSAGNGRVHATKWCTQVLEEFVNEEGNMVKVFCKCRTAME